MQILDQHLTNVVSQTSDKELTLHGVRMAGKAMVVELCALHKLLEPEQLHVTSLDEVESLQSLTEIDLKLRTNLGAPIWYSIAQALKYFSQEGAGFCSLRPENIYISLDLSRVYITDWISANDTNTRSSWLVEKADNSIEQMYLTQLAIFYHFLLSGENLYEKLENVEQSSWRDEHLKNAITTLNVEAQFKDNLLRATQLNGGFYTDISALVEGVRPFFFVVDPQGFLPFLSGFWIASSAITSITFMTLVLIYMGTLS